MIVVIAEISVAAGRRADFLKEFHGIVPEVRAEAGCIEYGPTIDTPSGIDVQAPLREDLVTIVEKWESVDALQAHLAAPHMLAYRQRVKDLVTGLTLRVLEPA